MQTENNQRLVSNLPSSKLKWRIPLISCHSTVRGIWLRPPNPILGWITWCHLSVFLMVIPTGASLAVGYRNSTKANFLCFQLLSYFSLLAWSYTENFPLIYSKLWFKHSFWLKWSQDLKLKAPIQNTLIYFKSGSGPGSCNKSIPVKLENFTLAWETFHQTTFGPTSLLWCESLSFCFSARKKSRSRSPAAARRRRSSSPSKPARRRTRRWPL